MPPIKALLAAAFAGLMLVACASNQEEISTQQRDALVNDMLEPDSLSSGYMPGMGVGSY